MGDPKQGDAFATLDAFGQANAEAGDNAYTEGILIETNSAQDATMAQTATEEVLSNYGLVGASCVDACSKALESVGLDGGTNKQIVNSLFSTGSENKSAIPNIRYQRIKENNPYIDVSKQIRGKK